MRNRTEVIFDGDCGLCRASADWLLRRDSKGHLTCTPSAQCDWANAKAYPFDKSVVVKTPSGEVKTASSAVAFAFSELPRFWGMLGRWVGLLNRNKGLKYFHDALYYAVAERRHAISRGLVKLRILDRGCLLPLPNPTND